MLFNTILFLYFLPIVFISYWLLKPKYRNVFLLTASYYFYFSYNPWFLLLVSILSVYMLNAEIPLFSLKIKKFSFKENALQIIFLSTSIFLLVFFQYLGIPMIILFYVVLSVVNNKMLKK